MDDLPPVNDGQSPYLSEPITRKETETGVFECAGVEVQYALSSMQGWRVTQEDAHTIQQGIGKQKDLSFFGVFDGHGGSMISKHTAKNVTAFIENSDSFIQSKKAPTAESLANSVREGFIDLDLEMQQLPESQSGEDFSGSTGVTLMLTPSDLIVANVGDSRLCVVRDNKVLFATTDQKPSNPEEQKRIEKAGGSVVDNRVNGDLASARAFGDYRYKMDEDIQVTEQQISPEPKIDIIPRDIEKDQFVVIACDGIFDVISNLEVTKFIIAAMELGCTLATACERVLEECLKRNSGDNMSIMLVVFPKAPKEIGLAKKKQPGLKKIKERVIDSIL